jgi:gamma-glutamylcyclotransferase (GGCT)/AIG2-like uncharacterized protein YtfP
MDNKRKSEETDSKHNELVFVYGTLKKGYSNHRLLEGATCFGEAEVRDYSMVDGPGFPYAFPKTHSWVKGEVYEVDDLGPLDRLEGYPGFYNRSKVIAQTGMGGMECWIYHLNKNPSPGKKELESWTR